jgi:hypothetical protein
MIRQVVCRGVTLGGHHAGVRARRGPGILNLLESHCYLAGRKINSGPKCGQHRSGEATAEPDFVFKQFFFLICHKKKMIQNLG